ncbi:MAG: hypothetical protein B6D73_18285 [gamma proteobacterium symbiont of Stewartia floridana]|nr:MAG: hypothetical protein B6D73_18285 [gamma proteobacterium symbiont of Stewartia floridana]
MTTVESITLAIAVLGAVLGVINTWVGLSKEKVKLIVTPKHAIPVGGAPEHLEFCVEVVNLSAFPVTVSEVGVFYRGTDKRSVIPNPITSDGKPFPRRLESRSGVTLYSEKPRPLVNGKRMKCAFAKTDCGVVVKGNSPAFRQIANEI